jgi:hypothetical protein
VAQASRLCGCRIDIHDRRDGPSKKTVGPGFKPAPTAGRYNQVSGNQNNSLIAARYGARVPNYPKAFLFWLGFLAVAFSCGGVRESLLVPLLGPLPGRALGTVLVGAIILGLIYRYVRKLKDPDRHVLCKLGIFWTVLTLGFESLVGHYVMGVSWELLLADYNVLQGRLWPLVLIVTLFGPLWAQKLRDYYGASTPA